MLRRWIELVQQDEPVEFIRGQIVRKAMPTIEHGGIQGQTFAQLASYMNPASGKTGWWLSQEVDMFIGGEGVRPDVVGWRKDKHPVPPKPMARGPHKGVITVAPDWICEVLSPSTASRDLGLKLKAYHRAKVGHYWIVDPLNEVLTVYRWSRSEYGVLLTAGPDDGKIEPPPFADSQFDINLVFLIARAQAAVEPPPPKKKRKAG